MGIVELSHVWKVYRPELWSRRVAAVRDLSFSLEGDGIVGFVGPNGAGKTTTIKMILGLIRPTKGRVTLFGRPSLDPAARRSVAYVSEQPYFYGHLTVAETVRFIAELRGIPPRGIQAEISRVLGTVELQESSGKKVRELSKGMQQRLNMAQALLGDPALLIMDEPMSGMDPPGRNLFRRLLAELRQSGKTVFFSTHILEDIETLCDRVIVLSKGECTYDGTVGELLTRGYEGTQITVAGLTEDMVKTMLNQGCRVVNLRSGVSQILVPPSGDVQRVQKMIMEAGLYCEEIIQRRKSLESLLYASGKGRI